MMRSLGQLCAGLERWKSSEMRVSWGKIDLLVYLKCLRKVEIDTLIVKRAEQMAN